MYVLQSMDSLTILLNFKSHYITLRDGNDQHGIKDWYLTEYADSCSTCMHVTYA